ncbi:MAG: DUF4381 family protein [Verrucomicrobia bacterium]|nr:DUF4381 family protein [Verrucomicrobiota bacterium]
MNTNTLQAANDIRDIKADVLILPPWWVWALLVLAAAAVVLVVWLVLKKRRQEAKEVFVPRQNAVEEARERLEAARKLMLAGEIEAFYIAVSDAVRQYIERQFRLRAAEQTTEEFLQDMTRSQRMRPTHKELLEEFLTQCDLVKFARFRPGPKDMEAALAAATRFVDETVPQEVVSGSESKAQSPDRAGQAPAATTQS